ncbi:Retrovirus-related Pol polyprotein from transposon 17.6 [Trichinella zimbabwensis]|uniref:Retrovirus-related Pol polyprotein from transposon 17.6 n=1 Tax=Trichinella zimbabwensis TaxID=268475 RepID=A0A0V1I6A4_9BILA|nr:Retrovirus-related Pol polyprotein from transposon 17.6 [Trichinella zimbabwensis]
MSNEHRIDPEHQINSFVEKCVTWDGEEWGAEESSVCSAVIHTRVMNRANVAPLCATTGDHNNMDRSDWIPPTEYHTDADMRGVLAVLEIDESDDHAKLKCIGPESFEKAVESAAREELMVNQITALNTNVSLAIASVDSDGKILRNPWAYLTLLTKKDRSCRFIVDYQQLNNVTCKDAQLSKKLQQLNIAFTTPFGLYQYKVMPFGLCNVPATFQRFMRSLVGSKYLVYLDNVIVFRRTYEQAACEVLDRWTD